MKRILLPVLISLYLTVSSQNRVTNKTTWNVTDFVADCTTELKIDSVEIEFISYPRLVYSKYESLTYRDGSKYVILIFSVMSYDDALKAIAHELVHVQQLHTKRLQILSNDKIRFDDKVYQVTELSHYSDPQEVEARKEGDALYKKFKDKTLWAKY